MRSRLPALVALALLAALAVPAAVGAKPLSASDLHRARVLAYWTPARIASAIPKDYVRDSTGQLVPKARPGGGGDIKGASWTGNGTIELRSGRILFTQGGSNWICSGSVVTDGSATASSSTILTAGHCVYDGSDGWATYWVFIPDFDDAPTYTCANTALGCWVADRLAVHEGFYPEGFGNDTVDVDYGFAFVGLGGKGSTGTLDLDDVVGAYGLKTSTTSLSDQQWAFGYPAAGRYKGRDLVYCTNTTADLIDDPYGADTWGMACNQTGGSSGGPWLHGTTNPAEPGGTVASNNSYGYSGLSYMFGPKFNSQTLTVLGDVRDGSETGGVSQVQTLP